MSHVNDGTLHAYLDGELAPVERERVESHLVACPPCRERLAEERALIERASRLLELAVPPATARPVPPLHTLRHQPGWWKVRAPLAWAATLVLAIGLGWYLRGTTAPRLDRRSTQVAVTPAAEPTAPAPASGRAEEPPRSRQTRTQPARAPLGSSEVRDAAALQRSDRPATPPAAAKVAPPPQLGQNQAETGVRGEAAGAPEGAAAAVAMPSAQELPGSGADSDRLLASTWTVIEPSAARQLLGTEPVTIPGHPVRSMRRGPGSAPEVLVEQDVGGVVVMLFERPPRDAERAAARREVAAADTGTRMPPAAAAARPAGGALGRLVGQLFVRIAGPMPADSLAGLLRLVR